MEMVLDKNYHIFKVTKKIATGDCVLGYYYSDDKKKVEEYLHKWDVHFDNVEVIPIVDIVNDINVGGRRRHHQSITDTEIGRMFRKIIGGHHEE